jgi:choline monooxygenase
VIIDPDIRRAETPPGALYADPDIHKRVIDRFLRTGFHVVAHLGELPPRACVPITLLEEPLLITRDDAIHVMSNVCTHRANILVETPCTQPTIRCAYHGRRFTLDGRMTHMPEFEDAVDFPRKTDDLPHVAHRAWGPLLFASLDGRSFDTSPLDRVAHYPIDRAVFDPETSRDYEVAANWALYVDNYLEGFHIPFVHPGLSRELDYNAYETELFDGGTLQLGFGKDGKPAAYYFWLAPTTMINVYPWGLSVNVVVPRAVDRTTVRFWSFVWDPSLREQGAGAGLHQVEMEDERVVQSVQRGVRARLYSRGRYSPSRERGVHHFHRMLAAALT